MENLPILDNFATGTKPVDPVSVPSRVPVKRPLAAAFETPAKNSPRSTEESPDVSIFQSALKAVRDVVFSSPDAQHENKRIALKTTPLFSSKEQSSNDESLSAQVNQVVDQTAPIDFETEKVNVDKIAVETVPKNRKGKKAKTKTGLDTGVTGSSADQFSDNEIVSVVKDLSSKMLKMQAEIDGLKNENVSLKNEVADLKKHVSSVGILFQESSSAMGLDKEDLKNLHVLLSSEGSKSSVDALNKSSAEVRKIADELDKKMLECKSIAGKISTTSSRNVQIGSESLWQVASQIKKLNDKSKNIVLSGLLGGETVTDKAIEQNLKLAIANFVKLADPKIKYEISYLRSVNKDKKETLLDKVVIKFDSDEIKNQMFSKLVNVAKGHKGNSKVYVNPDRTQQEQLIITKLVRAKKEFIKNLSDAEKLQTKVFISKNALYKSVNGIKTEISTTSV
jgi:hypothetical protein